MLRQAAIFRWQLDHQIVLGGLRVLDHHHNANDYAERQRRRLPFHAERQRFVEPERALFEILAIETGPNGNLFVVSLANGAIYEIFRR